MTIEEYNKYIENNDFKNAEIWLLNKLESEPENTFFYFELSKIYFNTGRLENAADLIKLLIVSHPENFDYQLSYALINVELKNYDIAEEAYNNAILLSPNNDVVNYNYGVLLSKIEQYDKAITYYQNAINLNPNFEQAYYNCGEALIKIYRLDDAVNYLIKCLEINDKNTDAIYNLAIAYERKKNFILAIKYYNETLKINPNHHEARWNKSLLLLREGNYREGFQDYEVRLEKRELTRTDINYPEWKGESLKNKTILVYYEQGYGDFFQFVRYLEILAADAEKIILEVKPELQKLARSLTFVHKFCNKYDKQDEKIDYQIACLSLANLYHSQSDKLPDYKPYLHALPESVKKFSELMDTLKYKVGFLWTGNKFPVNNRIRHTELKYFETLIKNFPQINFYSIQFGEDADELNTLNYPNVFDYNDHINDFNDTAAIIENLNLVITIDTSVAHLAGALGKESWLLLSNSPDWRWFAGQEYSDWYPRTKFYRSSITRGWDQPFELINKDLQKLCEHQDENVVSSKKEIIRLINNNDLEPALNIINSKLSQNEFDYYYYSATISLMSNDFISAENILRQVKTIQQDEVRYLNLLASIKLKQFKMDEAINLYSKVLKIKDDSFEAISNIVIIKINIKDFEDVDFYINKLLILYPQNYLGYYYQAIVQFENKNFNEAEKYFVRALNYQPDSIDVINSLVFLYLETNRLDEANVLLNSVILEEDINTLNNKAKYYLLKEEFNKAKDLFLRIIKLYPENYDAKINLAYVYFLLKDFEESLNLYLELDNQFHNSELCFNIGVTFQELGELEKSYSYLKQAVEMSPDNHKYHIALAEVLLLEEDYENGWIENEWRHQEVYYSGQICKTDNFDLNKIGGKKILIYDEQGYGDIFQFVRYIKLLKEKGATTIFQVRKDLINIFDEQTYIDVVTDQYDKTDYDYAFHLMSIPHIIYKSINTPLENVPYLYINKTKKLDSKKIKTGIVWKGKQFPVHNRKRHIELDEIKKIFELEHLDFYSLQLEITNEEKSIFEQFNNIKDLAKNISDFYDTAEIFNDLDIIITVDTAVAHLAGAMNKKVILMLPTVPDWRWLMETGSSPWYPNTIIFRQEKRGEWNSVIEKIYNYLLKEHLSENGPEVIDIQQNINDNKLDLALRKIQKLINVDQANPEVYNLLGILYSKIDNGQKAIEYFTKSLELNPSNFKVKLNLANMIFHTGEISQALNNYRMLYNENTNSVELLYNYGVALTEIADYKKAYEVFVKACKINPEFPEAQFNKGLIDLRFGNYKDGWNGYNWCKKVHPEKYKKLSKPEWKGEALQNKKLFIYSGQGLGDVIQFSRYFKLVKELGAEIYFECYKNLIELIDLYGVVDHLIVKNKNFIEPEEYDYQIELMSLPKVFKTTINSVPAPAEKLKEIPIAKLESKKLKVGLTWSGNPDHKYAQLKSINPDLLFPKLIKENIKYYNFQFDCPEEIKTKYFEKYGVYDIFTKPRAFLETAEYMNAMDIIITIDTSAAHLAGTLGKKVWLLLNKTADWRWIVDEKTTPWYKSMKIFWQTENGKWNTVLDEINRELKKLVDKK